MTDYGKYSKSAILLKHKYLRASHVHNRRIKRVLQHQRLLRRCYDTKLIWLAGIASILFFLLFPPPFVQLLQEKILGLFHNSKNIEQLSPLDLAARTFVVLISSTSTAYSRLPGHIEHTFKWFPHHRIYSDREFSILGEHVVDPIQIYPEQLLKEDPNLKFRELNEIPVKKMWHWQPDEFVINKWPLIQYFGKYMAMPALADAWCTSKSEDWYLLLKDSTFFLPSTLSAAISGKDPNDVVFLGRAGGDRSIYAETGPGVILSKGAMKFMFGNSCSSAHREAIDSGYFARSVGSAGEIIAERLSLRRQTVKKELERDFTQARFQGRTLVETKAHFNAWCKPLGSFDGLKTPDMKAIAEWYDILEIRYPGYVPTYSDFYEQFISLHVKPILQGWLAHFPETFLRGKETVCRHSVDELDTELNSESADTVNNEVDLTQTFFRALDDPIGQSAIKCRAQCELNARCYQWSHNSMSGCELILDGVVAGVAFNDRRCEYIGERAKMGYMVDRINKRRQEASCDPLRPPTESPVLLEHVTEPTELSMTS